MNWGMNPMQPHPYFNLLLHEQVELEDLLGVTIDQRVTLQEWPLSCVQLLTLANGQRVVYKAAYGPTTEADFYARMQSPLLIQARTLYQQDGYECLLLEWVEAPTLEEVSLPEEEYYRLGLELMQAIAAIQGRAPCYLDGSTPARWRTIADKMVDHLIQLEEAGELRQLTPDSIRMIDHWSRDAEVVEILAGPSGLVHGDLNRDNIFMTPDGLRVIDWQRPMFAPQGLDWVTFLESAEIELHRHVPAALIRLRRLLSIHWFVECAIRWFPQGVETYDRQIAELVSLLESGN
jgi:hypothetical protein